MTQMDCALDLAKKGFHVFPLRPNSKLPAIEDFPHQASRDPKKIEKWWTDPVMGLIQPFNVGISTTRFADDETLVVVDVDNKGSKKGDEEVLKLELAGFDFPETMEQMTPTGGRHLIYKCDKPVRQGVDKLGSGLDIRADGGYIVGAGSTLDNIEYTMIDREIVDSPDWLTSKLGESAPKTEVAPAPKKLNKKRAIERATFYLQNEAPRSVKGEGGDFTAYKVAARVKDFGVDQKTCLDLMLSPAWDDGCGWTADKLEAKVDHAYKYGAEPIGASSPEAEFKSVIPDSELFYLDAINKDYALVYVEGGHFILHETVDEKGRRKRSFLTEQTFKRKFSPKTIQSSGKGRALTQAEVWIDWEGRREFAGLCFAPERAPRHGYYNLWSGFTVDPITPELATAKQKQGVEMFLDHAKENVCGGEQALFTWLMGYFAHMVQIPWERPLTTLVFKGEKGTGKNALIEAVGKLLGSSHYLVAHDGRYLTSNFNGHMDSCLMLVLDEAFWSGDKAAEGKLKGITTAPEIMIERKGKEPYMVDNLVRLVVIGNEDWLIPASQDERRYAVFQMGVGKKQDREFFRKMRILLDEEGGAGLLLSYLKTFDLTTVDINDAPKTQALLEQKLKSASAFEQWWHECLLEGTIVRYDFPNDEWPERISKSSVRTAFNSYCKERRITTKFAQVSDRALGMQLHAAMPSIVMDQKIPDDSNKRVNAYVFPPLAQARKEFEKKMGHEVNWT